MRGIQSHEDSGGGRPAGAEGTQSRRDGKWPGVLRVQTLSHRAELHTLGGTRGHVPMEGSEVAWLRPLRKISLLQNSCLWLYQLQHLCCFWKGFPMLLTWVETLLCHALCWVLLGSQMMMIITYHSLNWGLLYTQHFVCHLGSLLVGNDFSSPIVLMTLRLERVHDLPRVTPHQYCS